MYCLCPVKPFLRFTLDFTDSVFFDCSSLSTVPYVTAESKPQGMVLQEDIWDADVDLHQKLLKRWKEIKERSGHK